jgi:hypothetical protein
MSNAVATIDQSPPPISRRAHDWQVLVLCTAALVAAALLEVVDGQFIAIRGFPQHPFPQTCFSRSWLSLDCPGCGLTRSFVLLAHGRFAESFAMHHVGIPLAVAFALQIPYRALRLWRPDRDWVAKPWRQAFSWLLVGMILGNWLLKLTVPGW